MKHLPRGKSIGTDNLIVYPLLDLAPEMKIKIAIIMSIPRDPTPYFVYIKDEKKSAYSLDFGKQHLEDAWNNPLVTIG